MLWCQHITSFGYCINLRVFVCLGPTIFSIVLKHIWGIASAARKWLLKSINRLYIYSFFVLFIHVLLCHLGLKLYKCCNYFLLSVILWSSPNLLPTLVWFSLCMKITTKRVVLLILKGGKKSVMVYSRGSFCNNLLSRPRQFSHRKIAVCFRLLSYSSMLLFRIYVAIMSEYLEQGSTWGSMPLDSLDTFTYTITVADLDHCLEISINACISFQIHLCCSKEASILKFIIVW